MYTLSPFFFKEVTIKQEVRVAVMISAVQSDDSEQVRIEVH